MPRTKLIDLPVTSVGRDLMFAPAELDMPADATHMLAEVDSTPWQAVATVKITILVSEDGGATYQGRYVGTFEKSKQTTNLCYLGVRFKDPAPNRKIRFQFTHDRPGALVIDSKVWWE